MYLWVCELLRSKNNLICLSGGNDNETNLGVRCDACQAAMGVGPRRICAEVLHERQVKGSALPLDTPKTAMEVRATQRREQRQLLRDKYKRKEEQRVRDLALIEVRFWIGKDALSLVVAKVGAVSPSRTYNFAGRQPTACRTHAEFVSCESLSVSQISILS